MPRVCCRTRFCAHNLGGEFCNAAEIEINSDTRDVQEETDCGTFIPRAFSGSLVVLDNVNYAGLVTQAFSGAELMNPVVKCTVTACHYNDQHEGCRAEEIEVDLPEALTSTDTFCRTFHE